MKSDMKSVRKSLSLKLSLGVLLVAVVIFTASLGLLFLETRRIVRQQAQERVNSVLVTTMQRLVRYLNTVETATDINEWLIMENLRPDSLLYYSRQIVALNGNVDGCSITTEPGFFPQYGRYFSAYTVREGDSLTTVREEEYEYFEKAWYKTPRLLGKACWIDPYDDFTEGTLSSQDSIISYCKPLYLPDGKMAGVIATDIRTRRLEEAINKEQPYPNSYFKMTDSRGNNLFHPDSTRISQPSIISSQRVPGTEWTLTHVCPESDILRQYHKLAWILGPLVFIGLLLIVLFCSRTTSLAVKPLKRLLGLSKQIAEGHYALQIPHSHRTDAVGRLQNSFATMQESLDRHITDIRQANEETAHRNQQLAEATRMAEEAARQKALFIQNMTHQIRTPLNIIMGFSEVLRDNHGQLPEEELKSISDLISHNTTTLNRMVLMLFDSSDTGYAKELLMQKQELTVCMDLVRESIETTRRQYPYLSVTLETEIPETLAIRTNRLYLLRSLRELLYNAAKYTDGQNVRMHVTQTDNTVVFTIEDVGPGITEDYREQMYQPFTKIDDLSEGLGLGLPLTLRHVHNLGGELTLDPDYHEGCRFIMELPKSHTTLPPESPGRTHKPGGGATTGNPSAQATSEAG